MTDTNPEMELQNFSCFRVRLTLKLNLGLRNFRLFVAVLSLAYIFTELAVVENAEICRGNFNAICCSSRDINIFELGDHVAISGGCPSLSPGVSIPTKANDAHWP